MCDLSTYKIDLKGLSTPQAMLEFALDNDFFKSINAPDVHQGKVDVRLFIRKTADFFELMFHIEGEVLIPCNLCLDDMVQPVVAETKLTVKMGDTYTEDDDLIVIDRQDGMIDVAWFIYESIVLAIPIRHVHQPGVCNTAMAVKLHELSTARSSSNGKEQEVDPRWEALKKLKY